MFGKGRQGKEESRKERNSKEWNGMERKGDEREGKDRNGKGRGGKATKAKTKRSKMNRKEVWYGGGAPGPLGSNEDKTGFRAISALKESVPEAMAAASLCIALTQTCPDVALPQLVVALR